MWAKSNGRYLKQMLFSSLLVEQFMYQSLS